VKLLTARVAPRMSMIVDGKRSSRDTLNAGGQKDLSNLMKIKYFLFVKFDVYIVISFSWLLL